MKLKVLSAGVALAAALGMAGFASVANAAAETIDPTIVQSLASGIESALSGVGCSGSAGQDEGAIQSAIAGSGATPREAQAAISVAQSSSGICGSQAAALASVGQSIAASLEASGAGAGPGAGPGGSSPLGSPPSYVGGGGSNYQTP